MHALIIHDCNMIVTYHFMSDIKTKVSIFPLLAPQDFILWCCTSQRIHIRRD